MYVNRLLAGLVPAAVVTSTLLAGPVPKGVVQVIEVDVLALNEPHTRPSMVTPVALLRSVPVIVTRVPPAVVPLLGLIEVTVGGPK